MISVVWFLISEHMECDSCNIHGADKWDLAITACHVYLALAFNYETLSPISKTAKTMYGLVCTKGHASVIKYCYGAYLLYARLSSVCKLILVSWSPH